MAGVGGGGSDSDEEEETRKQFEEAEKIFLRAKTTELEYTLMQSVKGAKVKQQKGVACTSKIAEYFTATKVCVFFRMWQSLLVSGKIYYGVPIVSVTPPFLLFCLPLHPFLPPSFVLALSFPPSL